MYAKHPNKRCDVFLKLRKVVVCLVRAGVVHPRSYTYVYKALCLSSWDCGAPTPVEDLKNKEDPPQIPYELIRQINVLDIVCFVLRANKKC